MNSIVYNDMKYVQAEYVLHHAPIYSKGCRGTRDMLKKKNITDYIFMRYNKDKWEVSNGSSQKFDKVFIPNTLLDNIPELNNMDTIVDDNGIEKAPPIIYLKEHEKFYDNDGNTLDIETRGERNINGTYFKVKDVMEGFNIKRLNEYIVDKRRDGYIENKHYKYFICIEYGSAVNTPHKELFLTYNGIMRVLFASQSSTADKFLYWATNTLFAVQMGTEKQKNELVSNIKGVSYESIQELFSINAREMPCVYLTALNTVDVLRNEMNIDMSYPNDSIVYKFGKTIDFETRKNGHKQDFKKINHLLDMKLVCYTYIDPLHITNAENYINDKIEHLKFKWDDKDELVILSKEDMKCVKIMYENVGMKYAGHAAENNKQIQEFENEIENLKLRHTYELTLKDNEIMSQKYELTLKDRNHEIMSQKYELLLKEKDNEILKKELEIMKLKYEK
jgi:hypothetical protein